MHGRSQNQPKKGHFCLPTHCVTGMDPIQGFKSLKFGLWGMGIRPLLDPSLMDSELAGVHAMRDEEDGLKKSTLHSTSLTATTI